VISGVQGRVELSVFRLDGRPPLPLEQSAGIQGAIWSRDGTRVFFASNAAGGWAPYSILSDGSALQPQPTPITSPDSTNDAFVSPPPMVPLAWMPNGHLLLAGARRSGSAALNADLVTVPAEGGKTEDLIRTEFVEDAASVSPDGQWLAYRSTRSGRPEIWVQSVSSAVPVRVSQNGGREPLWSRDGRELYYLEGNKLVALVVKAGQEFSFGAPSILFDQPYFHGLGGPGSAVLDQLRSYDVAGTVASS
jgi:Tol biopolymer transport system component